MGSVVHRWFVRRRLATGLAMTMSLAWPLEAQSPQELFQQALTLERSAGKMDSAIALYRRAITGAGPNRALAARALIRLGGAYEALGRTEARASYERVVRDFADQSEFVGEARRRIAAIDAPEPRGPARQTMRVAWSGPEVNRFALPSPDRRYTTYTDWTTGDLAIHDLVTGQNRRLTKEGGSFNPPAYAETGTAFSADSRQIAYTWWTPGAPGGAKAHYEVRSISVTGGEPRIIATLGQELVNVIAWMPRADGILVTVKEPSGDGYLAIVRMTGRIERVKSYDWRGISNASLSPDGRWVVFDLFTGTQVRHRDIHIIAVDGSRESVLVRHDANDWNPMWAPSGDAVVFNSDRSGAWRVWRVEVDGGVARGTPLPLTADMGRYWPIGFTRDGAFWYSPLGGSDIAVADIDPTSGRLTGPAVEASKASPGGNQSPDWSPDGKSLVFLSLRASAGLPHVMAVLNTETGAQRELTPPLAQYRRPRWSPDGRTILLAGTQRDGRHGWFRVDVGTGNMSSILLQDAPTVRAEWSADGRSFYYTRADSGSGASLRRYDFDAGTDLAVLRDTTMRDILDLAPSPDGQWLAYTVNEGRGRRRTRLLSLTQGTVRDLSSTRAYLSLNWMPDSRALLCVYSGSAPAAPEVWRVPVDGSEPVRIDLGVAAFAQYRVDRTGRRVAFVTQTASQLGEQLWVMENLLPRASTPR